MIQSYQLKDGSYFIGDPCYLLSDIDYQAWVQAGAQEGLHYQRRSLNGLRKHWVSINVGGDGSFETSDPMVIYPCDSGCLAIIPEALCDPHQLLEHQGAYTHHDFTIPIDVIKLKAPQVIDNQIVEQLEEAGTLIIHSGRFHRLIFIH